MRAFSSFWSVYAKKKSPNLGSRHQPKHYVGGSNEFGNSREEVRKKKRPAFTNYFKVAVESAADNWMRPEGGRVAWDDSWKRQSVFTSVMLWWAATDREAGRERTSTEGHQIEDGSMKRGVRLQWVFLVLLFRRMPARSVCLSVWQSLFCLTPYLVVSHTARGETKIRWCLHKHQTPRSCLFLNQRLKKKKKKGKEELDWM